MRSRDLFRMLAIMTAAVLVALACAACVCKAGDTSPQCQAEAGAVTCAKLLGGTQGGAILKTVIDDLTNGVNSAAWQSDLLKLATQFGLAAVECAIGQAQGMGLGKVDPGVHGPAVANARLKLLERVKIWRALPRDKDGMPIPAAAPGAAP